MSVCHNGWERGLENGQPLSISQYSLLGLGPLGKWQIVVQQEKNPHRFTPDSLMYPWVILTLQVKAGNDTNKAMLADKCALMLLCLCAGTFIFVSAVSRYALITIKLMDALCGCYAPMIFLCSIKIFFVQLCVQGNISISFFFRMSSHILENLVTSKRFSASQLKMWGGKMVIVLYVTLSYSWGLGIDCNAILSNYLVVMLTREIAKEITVMKNNISR